MFNLGNKVVSPKLDQSCQTLSSKRHKVAPRLTPSLLGVTVLDFSKQIPQKYFSLCLTPPWTFLYHLPIAIITAQCAHCKLEIPPGFFIWLVCLTLNPHQSFSYNLPITITIISVRDPSPSPSQDILIPNHPRNHILRTHLSRSLTPFQHHHWFTAVQNHQWEYSNPHHREYSNPPPSQGPLKPPIITTTKTTQYRDYPNHLL